MGRQWGGQSAEITSRAIVGRQRSKILFRSRRVPSFIHSIKIVPTM